MDPIYELIKLLYLKKEGRNQRFLNKIKKKLFNAKKIHDNNYNSLFWLNPKMPNINVRVNESPYEPNKKSKEYEIAFTYRQKFLENYYSNLLKNTSDLFRNVQTIDFFLRRRIQELCQGNFQVRTLMSMHCGIIPFHLSNEEVGLAMSVHNDVITEEYLEKCEILGDKVTL